MVTQANVELGLFSIPSPVLFATPVLLHWLPIRITGEASKNNKHTQQKTNKQKPKPLPRSHPPSSYFIDFGGLRHLSTYFRNSHAMLTWSWGPESLHGPYIPLLSHFPSLCPHPLGKGQDGGGEVIRKKAGLPYGR